MSASPPVPTCTCNALRRLARRVSAIYDRHVAVTGLKTSQFSLPMILRVAPISLISLARRSATDRTTLTRNLALLIRSGWVRMAPGQDARQRIVALTEAGHRKVAGVDARELRTSCPHLPLACPHLPLACPG